MGFTWVSHLHSGSSVIIWSRPGWHDQNSILRYFSKLLRFPYTETNLCIRTQISTLSPEREREHPSINIKLKVVQQTHTPFAQDHVDKPDWLLEECSVDEWDQSRAFWPWEALCLATANIKVSSHLCQTLAVVPRFSTRLLFLCVKLGESCYVIVNIA